MSDLTVRSQPEWFEAVPRSVRGHAVAGVALFALAFGGFGYWAFTAPLAAAVISQGSFVATGQNKIIQHLEGGIIEQIYVSEGDRVEEGDVLMRLDRTAAQAVERELNLRLWRLEAVETRLLAESEGQEELVFSPHLEEAKLVEPEVAGILDGQMLTFNVTRSELDNELRLLQRDIEALTIRSAGYRSQLESHQLQLEILTEEFTAQDELLDQGLTRRGEVASIRRAMIEAEGQLGRLQAEIDEIEEVSARYEAQMANAIDEYRRKALEELQVTQAEIDALRERSMAARDVSDRVEILSPVDGTIVRLHYNTPGGVVETGKPIAEILPAAAPLIVEALVPRNEVDSVREGETAQVRLTALNQRTTPVLTGTVEYLSADSVTDQSTGVIREVYVARIGLTPEELDRVPGNFMPTPGMPAEVMIQTEERTFAQYIARPITDSMTRAFRED